MKKYIFILALLCSACASTHPAPTQEFSVYQAMVDPSILDGTKEILVTDAGTPREKVCLIDIQYDRNGNRLPPPRMCPEEKIALGVWAAALLYILTR